MSPPPLSSTVDDGDDAHRTHTFKIVTTKRTLLLCAPSEEEEIKWLGAIRALTTRRSGAGIVPGDSGGKSMSSDITPSNSGGLKGKARKMSISGEDAVQ
jgi:pleckstrin homology domain-containing family A member 1/2